MDYIITIGKNYIGCDSGRYTEVTDINQAIRGPIHKLSNLVKNCVAPDKRKKCKIVAEDSVNPVPVVVTTSTVHEPELTEQVLFDDIISKLKTLGKANFEKEHNELSKRRSRIDQEVSDILHYIEFNKFNAVDGYKAYKLLRDKLLERRAVKNDEQKFTILSDAKVSDIFDGTLDKKLETVSNKKYTPRVLKELFVEGKD